MKKWNLWKVIVLLVCSVALSLMVSIGLNAKAKVYSQDGDLIINYGSYEAVVADGSMEINMTGARNLEEYSLLLIATTLSWVATLLTFLMHLIEEKRMKK